jgi:hypothetical protein
MSELITDIHLLKILIENNFNQVASARFLANKSNPENYEKFRYLISKRIALCEFLNEANKEYKDEQAKISYDKIHPLIKQQFCKERNKGIDLHHLSPGSHTIIQLICCKCGETFSSKIKNLQRSLELRKNKDITGCPYCANKKINKSNSFGACYPELLQYWDYLKNKGITPFDVPPGSDEKFYFICEFGHSFDARLYNITNKKRPRWCPDCKLKGTSFLEIVLYWELQYLFGDAVIWNKISKIAKKTYGAECDILLTHPVVGSICIEIDSRYHRTKKSLERDKKKNTLLETHGIKVIRLRHETLIKISDKDIFYNDDQDYKIITSNFCLALLQFSGFSQIEVKKIHGYVKIPYLTNLEKIRHSHKFLLQGTYDNKFLDVRPDLEKHWMVEKNLPYCPDFFSAGVHHLAHWKCPECGSETLISIREMVKRKNPCIPCFDKSRKVADYPDSISAQFPELLKQWDWGENQELGLDPDKISPWSTIESHWVCEFGHAYTALIKIVSEAYKAGNTGCKECKYNRHLIDIDGAYESAASIVEKIRSACKKNVLNLNSTIILVQRGFTALHCRAFALLSRGDKLAIDLLKKEAPATHLEQYLKKTIIGIFLEKIEPELYRFEMAITKCNGNVSTAEKMLGVRKSYINDYCRKRGIKIPKKKNSSLCSKT